MRKKFDAVVIGGGHAGTEAVFALSKLVDSVALVTLDRKRVAAMPCNPAIGGSAKGIITREIDALGGVQGIFSDKALIQIKMLHANKGPAIQSIRAQIDKERYSEIVLTAMEALDNLTIIEDLVTELSKDSNDVIDGVILEQLGRIDTRVVVVTTGTYLASKILRGEDIHVSGPDGERTSNLLSQCLESWGLKLMRLKTGTPPRIYADSIDFSQVEREVLDENQLRFSHKSEPVTSQQIECFLTHTTPETHNIILENLHRSSMYSGLIAGVGPRYCPSIEDKIVRFKEKERHQIFFEPETAKCDVYYINGLSTSMPIDVQDKIVRSIPGLANARVQKWGYAIEYDAINPYHVKNNLEAKGIHGLFLAGQINGTSGYEEAAAQGLIAGINAARYLHEEEPLVLQRDEAYIGVMIDDLVTKGISEPYRMLTSRAEFRLLLRNDNVDERLHHIGHKVGLITDEVLEQTSKKYQLINDSIKELEKTYISHNSPLAQKYDLTTGISLLKLLTRPDTVIEDIIPDHPFSYELTTRVRLAGYIEKQERAARRMHKMERIRIPENIIYDDVTNLSTEAREKLSTIRPVTFGQASRIDGVRPSDIHSLMYHLNIRNHNE